MQNNDSTIPRGKDDAGDGKKRSSPHRLYLKLAGGFLALCFISVVGTLLHVKPFWAVLGNTDEPVCPHKYLPGKPQWVKDLYWLFYRNPLHNFTVYVVGLHGKPYEVFVREQGQWVKWDKPKVFSEGQWI